jgi:hypothetical protein
VAFSTDTTLTLMGGSTVEEEAITDFAYSNIANPIGWPFGVDYIEGSNENGNWKKWVDGRADADGIFTIDTDTTNTSAGSAAYYSVPFNVPLPLNFYSVSSAQTSLIKFEGGGIKWLGGSTSTSTTQITGLRIIRNVTGGTAIHKIGFRVEGTWK